MQVLTGYVAGFTHNAAGRLRRIQLNSRERSNGQRKRLTEAAMVWWPRERHLVSTVMFIVMFGLSLLGPTQWQLWRYRGVVPGTTVGCLMNQCVVPGSYSHCLSKTQHVQHAGERKGGTEI